MWDSRGRLLRFSQELSRTFENVSHKSCHVHLRAVGNGKNGVCAALVGLLRLVLLFTHDYHSKV
jgi:hypothetical protein